MTDWDGEAYARRSELQRAMIDEAMSGLTFRATDRVLDIGCGDGFLIAAIARLAPDGLVVGADPSRRMVAAADASVASRRSGPRFVIADARALPFDGGCFDAVVSFNALHWVPQQDVALRQIAAVLRPGGSVTVQLVCAGPRRSLEDVTMDATRAPRWASWFDGFTAPFVHPDPHAFADLARAAGLAVDDVTVADRQWDFGSREAFTQWSAMGSTAWTDRLPEDRRAAFVNEQIDGYEPLAGAPGLFRFMQMRARLHREQTG
ncbi:SAM-dependent methyltransferase [Mycolicibacterium madagascariense]|uniref:SAM-dependent methyltransferase n=1 Tax=Mycolicibacterium madagascariense TaxID=212765 RepID=A0A7I7XHI2_9MYCO|nr:class I SAM-dependent methyltransferase [Mycolicibacterium madagascariense]MCV7011559.1 methyltransferase domain-containing protein [Mycolicibacterium madagascariense]BBZ28666.1 SAM-dependent methyltransferase [Mycolicibacterium madagascariense]